jgi:hypothetical protein
MRKRTKVRLDLRSTATAMKFWTAGSKTPGEGAAAAGCTCRTKLPLLCATRHCTVYNNRAQETPGAPEDTRGNKEGHQKDRRAQRHHEDRRQAPEGTAGGSGETPRGPEGTTGGSEQAATPHGSNNSTAYFRWLSCSFYCRCGSCFFLVLFPPPLINSVKF